MELPFIAYPHHGRQLLGPAKGDTCRRGYGLAFMQKTGQTACGYCGLDFAASYENWLTMALDHVVPVSVCRALNLPLEWQEDCVNKVLACAACNGFRNRYQPSGPVVSPSNLEDFCDLRDRIFVERKKLIAASHEQERGFFASHPWEKHA